VLKTMNKVLRGSGGDFFQDQKMKLFINEQIPDIDVEDIFRPKKVEKKEGDENI
jgi:hypothetical protein